MQWMALGNLWFTLIIPAIIVLYLLKRKVEDRIVPSTLLWQRTLQNWEAVRPWERLKRNLLLLLQLLAACLLVLALLRPTVPTEGMASDHTVLVVDNSGSMMAMEGDKTRLDQAITEAEQFVEKLGNAQTMTVIEAGREPKVLVASSADRQALLQAIRTIQPQLASSDANAALSLAKAVAQNESGTGVIWLGDGGTQSLSEAVVPSVSGSFRFIQVGRKRENTAIGAFVTQPAAGGAEGMLRIDNHGSQKSSGSVTIYDGENKLLDTDAFSVEAGASHTLSFSGLPASFAYRAVIEPQQDGLALDNEMWSVPFAAQSGKAVLVSPAGNRFLHQVLQTVGSLDVESRQQYKEEQEDAKDLWVFDGVVPDRLPEGNILLFAPNRTTDWLPFVGDKELSQASQPIMPDDPLLTYVDWHDVHVAKTAQISEMPGMHALVRAGDTDLIRAGTIDGRRVVIVGFDLHDSDFPLRTAFPIFMQNSIAWLSSAQMTPIPTASPGEMLTIPLTPGAGSRSLTYPDHSEQAITSKGTGWMLQVPDQTGLYRLDEKLGIVQQSRYFPVQLSEGESDIAPRSIRVNAEKGVATKGERKMPTGQGSMELTYWLAALALIVVFVEWRVYQRGY